MALAITLSVLAAVSRGEEWPSGHLLNRDGAGHEVAIPPTGLASATWVRSARSGRWSDPATWEIDKVPGHHAKVQVRPGHTVLYDVRSNQVIRAIHVAGILTFATDRDTELNVGLIKIQPGVQASENGFDCDAHEAGGDRANVRPALEVGTPDAALPPQHCALIRLHYIEGMEKESCPAIVCCGGRMDFHGAPMSRTWVKLGAPAHARDRAITLAELVQGWRTGDKVIVTATQRDDRQQKSFTEESALIDQKGTQLHLSQPLRYEHLGGNEYAGEVANLSRNVIVESADVNGVRGHTMYHRGSSGSISFAEFRHLGKEGVLGKYALHYHLVGSTMRGSSVLGASIWDSRNRWLTIHGTNYLVVRDCVGFSSVGHGFYLEDGTEVYNTLDRNLAVGARRGKPLPKQILSFDQNEGAGFWWANSLNTFTRNVATGNGEYGFRFEASASRSMPLTLPVLQPDGSRAPVDIRTLPFVRFEDNEAHSTVGLYGVNLGEGVNRVGPDTRHPFIVRNLRLWDVHYAFRPQVPSLLVENLHIHEAAYGVYHPNYDHHVYRNVYIGKTETEPFNRGHDDLSVQYGPLTVDGLTFADIRSGNYMPLIQISEDNPTGAAVSHFRNVKTQHWTGSKDRAMVNRGGGPRPQPTTERGVPIYIHDWFGAGRHAKIVSTKTHELKQDGLAYRSEPLLTGDESRVAEVHDIEFPSLLKPVDDLPPATVITHVVRSRTKLTVRGTTSDNGTVKQVWVNGKPAEAVRPNFAEWEIVLDLAAKRVQKLVAYSEDVAGNVEKLPHEVVLSEAVKPATRQAAHQHAGEKLTAGSAGASKPSVEFMVVERGTDKPLPCRIHIRDKTGKAIPVKTLPYWHDHFVCPGTARLDLAPGAYTYEVERGPEYTSRSGPLVVVAGAGSKCRVELERLVDLSAEGWWSGELHVHRSVADMELLMQAEDLHVAPVITWWNNQNLWAGGKRLPDDPLVRFDGNRYGHVMAGEDEREGGALLFFNLRRPLTIAGSSREYPSPMKFVKEARQQPQVWIDIEKPFWWDVPVWLANGEMDSIGLANNHMCRSQMYENEAWGKPRNAKRLPAPLGNGYWSQEIYYHILNCGLRIPPSAGSASGVLPNPVGYNRVYVHLHGALSYEKWWQGLRAGCSFVTNGPLLRVTASGRLPGAVFKGPEAEEIELEVKAALTTRGAVRAIEIIKNGRVERSIPYEQWRKSGGLGKLRFTESGWFLVRAIVDNPRTFRFASTAPSYVEIGNVKRRVSRESARFFLDWATERAKRVKLTDPRQRQEVLRYHDETKKFWLEMVATATTD
jgi:hypothetical protein